MAQSVYMIEMRTFCAILVASVSLLMLGCVTPQEPAPPTGPPPAQTAATSTPPAPATPGGGAVAEERITCTGPMLIAEDREDIGRQTDLLIAVKNRHADELRAIPGVNGLGVGFIHRDGERTDEISIIVHVDARLPPEEVDPEDLIPTSIEGCAVSIKATAPSFGSGSPLDSCETPGVSSCLGGNTMSGYCGHEVRMEIPIRVNRRKDFSRSEDVMKIANDQGERGRQQDLLIAVKNRHADELRAISGVNGLGVGFVRRGGKRTAEIGIIVHVEHKLPRDRVKKEDLIPSSIEGFRVDVQESRPAFAHDVEASHRQATPGGIRISRFEEGFPGGGTLTGSAWKDVNGERKWYLVTALHVAADDPDNPVVDEEVHQPYETVGSPDLVAKVSEWVNQNQAYPPADAAICEYEDGGQDLRV